MFEQHKYEFKKVHFEIQHYKSFDIIEAIDCDLQSYQGF